jgi:hypothetical protein
MVDFTLKPEGYDVPPISTFNMAALSAALTALQQKVTAQDTTLSTVATTVTTQQQALVDLQVSNAARLTSTTSHTVGAGGLTTVTFTRSFDLFPGCTGLRVEASDSAGAVEFSVKSWIQDANGKYTGCVVRAKRQQLLPGMSGLTLVTAVISALANFDVFGGSAVGTQFTWIAVQRSA